MLQINICMDERTLIAIVLLAPPTLQLPLPLLLLLLLLIIIILIIIITRNKPRF
jgi:hypothetical protein